MNNEKYAKAIRKTGFVLENTIAEILKKHGWTVISNKYYEDDFEGSVREIDILAYKVTAVQQVNVYTTILLSCKKSEANIWALVSRDVNIKDPNSDWWPLHMWSNDKALAFEMSKPNHAKGMHEYAIAQGVDEALSVPSVEVFAFQEMNRESGAPQNDRSIFNSITSLMKAQSYEMGALPHRKKQPSVYQFNLLSVIDSELIRLKVSDDEIVEEMIESEHYISRYIVKRQETFSRIRFISASSFEDKIKDYSKLHNSNCLWVDERINCFYEGILRNSEKTNSLIELFKAKVKWLVFVTVKNITGKSINVDDLYISWDEKKNIPTIGLPVEAEYIEDVNDDKTLMRHIEKAFLSVYRYKGEFEIVVDDIPF